MLSCYHEKEEETLKFLLKCLESYFKYYQYYKARTEVSFCFVLFFKEKFEKETDFLEIKKSH